MGTGFRNLEVWQKAKALAVEVYRLTEENKLKRDFGLVDQMRRSAVSVASNIAEGDERDTDKDAVRIFYMAKGSAVELLTQLEIAEIAHELPVEVTDSLKNQCDAIARMLRSLIRARSSSL